VHPGLPLSNEYGTLEEDKEREISHIYVVSISALRDERLIYNLPRKGFFQLA